MFFGGAGRCERGYIHGREEEDGGYWAGASGSVGADAVPGAVRGMQANTKCAVWNCKFPVPQVQVAASAASAVVHAKAGKGDRQQQDTAALCELPRSFECTSWIDAIRMPAVSRGASGGSREASSLHELSVPAKFFREWAGNGRGVDYWVSG